jgi:hypothetical protein
MTRRLTRRLSRWLCAGTAATLTLTGLLAVQGTAEAKQDIRPVTMAVFGDAPYGTSNADTAEFGATPAFIDTINADPDVSSVVHVGDIHSGKQYCTEAYDRAVAQLWTRFADSLVYTPGDNEWADCHKPAEGGGTYNTSTGQIDYVRDANGNLVDYAGGDPVENLDLVRTVFFPTPGATLGAGGLAVQSQATAFDASHPEDSAYVENVRWQVGGVQFVTIDVPGGSNNDADPWYKAPLTQRQIDERTLRTAADLRWLDSSFANAASTGAKAVVVVAQADMWDLDGKAASHVTNYESLVHSLADHTNSAGVPVLLLNGDSHVFRSDNPFDATAPCTTEDADGNDVACEPAQEAVEAGTHPGYTVPGFHRIVVHGSTAPLEYLKLTIGARGGAGSSFGPFSWRRERTGLGF